MRIIAGSKRSMPLKTIAGKDTRPTTDRIKETLFNMIQGEVPGAYFLDLFAGSGGLSIEAVSRGISQAVLVDRQYQAIKTIKKNIDVTKHVEQFKVYKMDAHKALNLFAKDKMKFNLVFLDPPYAKQQIVNDMEQMVKNNLLAKDAIIVAETDQNAKLPTDLADFNFIRRQEYGITVLTIYQYEGESK